MSASYDTVDEPRNLLKHPSLHCTVQFQSQQDSLAVGLHFLSHDTECEG